MRSTAGHPSLEINGRRRESVVLRSDKVNLNRTNSETVSQLPNGDSQLLRCNVERAHSA